MIPHHQVAVDISEIHRKKSKSPKIQEMLRKLIVLESEKLLYGDIRRGARNYSKKTKMNNNTNKIMFETNKF